MFKEVLVANDFTWNKGIDYIDSYAPDGKNLFH